MQPQPIHHEERENRWYKIQSEERSKFNNAKTLGFLDTISEWGKIPDFFESPEEYYRKQMNTSIDIMNGYKDLANKFYTIGYSVTQQLTSNPDSHYRIFFAGRKYQFVPNARRGNFPLKPEG